MGFYLRPRLVMVQELKVPSQFLKSCFPKTEKLIQSKKMLVIKSYKWDPYLTKSIEYISLMDMVLCNLFPYYKAGCKRFYAGKGKNMIGLYSKPQLDFIDLQMVEELSIMLKVIQEGQ